MNATELKKRTKKFAIETILFTRTLPKDHEGKILGNQLFRSATSVAANYRAACRSKTNASFRHKIGIVEEEADESTFWYEVIDEIDLGDKSGRKKLLKEADELTAIFTATSKSVSRKK